MVDSKRIPAKKTEAFAAWAPPSMENGRTIPVERASSGRLPAGEGTVETVQRENFDQHLVENIKNGKVPGRLTAGQLEKIATQAYKEGHDEGHREGYAEGQRQGLADGKNEIAQRLSNLDGVLRDLLEPTKVHQAELEESITQLTIALSRAVIKRELSIDSSQITEIVQQALEALPAGSKGISVHVSTADHDLIKEYAKTNQLEFELTADESMRPGDCRVLTENSTLDYCASDRLTQLLEQFISSPDPS